MSISNFFADDWIQTADLWYRKQPLDQMSHNHCPERKRSFIVLIAGRRQDSDRRFASPGARAFRRQCRQRRIAVRFAVGRNIRRAMEQVVRARVRI